jgi:hypothetical protein
MAESAGSDVMSLKVVSVTRYEEPLYPTHGILDEHSELLKLVPKRWRGNPAVFAALAGACLLLADYKAQAGPNPKEQSKSLVAPIFEHGRGVAYFGGDGPGFVALSEEDARRIVSDEAGKAGLIFVPDSLILKNVNCPVTDPYAFLRRSNPPLKIEPSEKDRRQIPLQLDGTNRKKMVSYEYVSVKDFNQWRARGSSVSSTVDMTDSIGAARQLRESIISAKPAGYYGVFYDPGVSRDEATGGNPAIELPSAEYFADQTTLEPDLPRLQSKRQSPTTILAGAKLREQVRDFIKWLKGQGVI